MIDWTVKRGILIDCLANVKDEMLKQKTPRSRTGVEMVIRASEVRRKIAMIKMARYE